MTPCNTCHAGCCRSFAVPVTGADIIRIETELGLSFWDFVCRWADGNGNIARNTAPHFHFSDEPETPFVICLKHVDSRHLSGTTKCRFLEESPPDAEHPLGLARCGIYEHRPATCRAFPMKLDESGQLAILYPLPERGRSGETPAYELCPRPWEPDDVNPILAVQELTVARHEMLFFRELAVTWNRKPRPWNIFPQFLRLVYRARVVRETPIGQPEQPVASSCPLSEVRGPSSGKAA